MYLLIIKDGLVSRYFGPYETPKDASDDVQSVLSSFSSRSRWQINSLERPIKDSFSKRLNNREMAFNLKVS